MRVIYFIWSFSEADLSIFSILRTLFTGAFFDIGVLSFLLLPITTYLLLFPKKYNGKIIDRIVIYGGFFVLTIILTFSFFAEITFWEEFKRRFNFIAVDYLIYTYEVIQNINESYPLPLLIAGVLVISLTVWFFFKKRNYFDTTFHGDTTFNNRIYVFLINAAFLIFFGLVVTNKAAEWSENRYNNEISKAGIYSFFSAFRNNELSFTEFYNTENNEKAFSRVRSELHTINTHYISSGDHIAREINEAVGAERKKNVILICVESLSADVIGAYGNRENLTPNIDSIIKKSTWFSNMYATGTRTVRGMEALTLSYPPTPGRSIVKRKHNENLYNIGTVFNDKGYRNTFFYGGDGYFDNMDYFFSHNGFNIVDKSRGFINLASFPTTREVITDAETSFENAWGVCDEDLFNKILTTTDLYTSENDKPFFHFVMTTSNHRPYTYPEGKIKIKSGTGRKGAVSYTDYAIGDFFRKAATKSWYANTVFIIVADHCASSAGKWELDIANYHIPAIIFDPEKANSIEVNTLCSQIDLVPTLFGLLNWKYESKFYGNDVINNPRTERAFVGNYRKLGYLTPTNLMVLRDQKSHQFYRWSKDENQLEPIADNKEVLSKTIAFYQTADYLFHHHNFELKE
ncbi:LTA synthase family protein [Neptunitalea lumnitzerae]|uniref:LTA synthase family protein n=1 Tax=Neptunitalea lumnitzerae TaxID=2965509 RepID=UPI0024923FAA|nr:alkaline phosphatase family protein [Neptunitalea sp. Y10]